MRITKHKTQYTKHKTGNLNQKINMKYKRLFFLLRASCFVLRDKFKSAFTLLELIIVISIILLFGGLTLAYYNNFTEDQKLTSTASKFVDVLELAKKKAGSADTSMCASVAGITPAVEKYTVSENSNTSYRLAPNCTATSPTNQDYQTESGVIFQSFPNPIDFKPLTGGATSTCIVIKNNSNAKCRYVKVETSGAICDDVCTCGSCVCPSC